MTYSRQQWPFWIELELTIWFANVNWQIWKHYSRTSSKRKLCLPTQPSSVRRTVINFRSVLICSVVVVFSYYFAWIHGTGFDIFMRYFVRYQNMYYSRECWQNTALKRWSREWKVSKMRCDSEATSGLVITSDVMNKWFEWMNEWMSEFGYTFRPESIQVQESNKYI